MAFEDDIDIDWRELEAAAYTNEARRRGIDLFKRMYTTEPDNFAVWLKTVPDEEHFPMVLALLTIGEFLVDSTCSHLDVTPEEFLKCLSDLGMNG